MVRFGSGANDLESVVYAYLRPAEAPDVLTVPSWELAGPFPCTSYEDFERGEWPEEDPSAWPDSHVADFGQYQTDSGPAVFEIPVRADSEHGWCDFARRYRGKRPTNLGTQPCEVSAYAAGRLEILEQESYVIEVGYDDWLRVWINGHEIRHSRHERGFAVEKLPVELQPGQCEIRVKLSNFDSFTWRLWAFSLTPLATFGALQSRFLNRSKKFLLGESTPVY